MVFFTVRKHHPGQFIQVEVKCDAMLKIMFMGKRFPAKDRKKGKKKSSDWKPKEENFRV